MQNHKNIDEDQDLHKQTPLLFGQTKTNPFSAPDGYFEEFPQRLQERISRKSSSPAWLSFSIQPRVWATSFAILFVIAGLSFLQFTKNNTIESVITDVHSLSQPTLEELETFLAFEGITEKEDWITLESAETETEAVSTEEAGLYLDTFSGYYASDSWFDFDENASSSEDDFSEISDEELFEYLENASVNINDLLL